MDDEILETGFSPKKAHRICASIRPDVSEKSLLERLPLFRRAQRKVARRHFRDRKMLLYHEKERQKIQRQMGQDPYLDTPD